MIRSMQTVQEQNTEKDLERVNDFITQRLSDIKEKLTKIKLPPKGDMLVELRVWLDKDPLLADLYRDFINAENHLSSLPMRRSSDNPMLEILILERDSAKGNFEARLIELKTRAGAKGAWQMIKKQNIYKKNIARWKEEAERVQMLMREQQELRKARKALSKKRNKEDILTWLLIGMGMTYLLGKKNLSSFYNSQSYGLKYRFAKQSS